MGMKFEIWPNFCKFGVFFNLEQYL